VASSFRKHAQQQVAKNGYFDIAAVKAHAPIAEIIGKFVALKPVGREFLGLCPFHTDRKPSFRVIPHLGDFGRFHCFPCGATGDVVDFVAKMKGCDLRSACRFLVGDAALEFMDADRERLRREGEARRKRDERDAEARRRKAFAVWSRARAIGGTPAEGYLRARGIGIDLPARLRYAPQLWCQEVNDECPAMLGEMVDGKGTFASLHRTYLAKGTNGAWVKAALEKPKKMLGPFMGAAIRLRESGRAGGVLYVAEGIETALSVLEGLMRRPQALANADVWAAGSLVNMSRLALPSDAAGNCAFVEVVLCMDADMTDMRPAETEMLVADVNYGARGCKVLVAFPEAGMDFNDMAQKAPAEGACVGAG
jgi:DNA primase